MEWTRSVGFVRLWVKRGPVPSSALLFHVYNSHV